MRHVVLCIFCYALAMAVVIIVLRIEWLNAEAGGPLPSREYMNNDPAEGPVRWRASIGINEEEWLRLFGPKNAEHQPANRALTPAERSEMYSDIRKAQANNSLRAFVRTTGLLQYVLVPKLVVASVAMIRTKVWRYGLVPLIIGVMGGVAMFYRAYFTSLGM